MNNPPLSILLVLIFLGCDEPFSPKGEFRDDLVVYCIVSDNSSVHYARVYRTYDPPALDPFEHVSDNQIINAFVSVSDGVTETVFRDTVLLRGDTSRYQSPIHAYIGSPLAIERGKTYALRVIASGADSSTATMTIPTKGEISVLRNRTGIVSPGTATEPLIDIGVVPSPLARGILVRFFLKFEVLEDSGWTSYVEQVPNYIDKLGSPDEHWLYPSVERSPAEGVPYPITYLHEFQVDANSAARQMLFGRYYPKQLRFVSAIFVLTQIEKSLYNYYNLAHGFQDPLTIRTDQPDFTNITSGVGVFGGFVNDSLIISLQ